VFDFLTKIFAREQSSTTAKERLRLVLLSDHLSLAPDVLEALKRDLVDVISRYVEVDRANCDVSFEQQDAQVAMLANIPILALRSRPMPPAAPTPPSPPSAKPPESFGTPAGASASVVTQPDAAPLTTPNAAPSAPDANAKTAVSASAAAPSRRRRRRRGGGGAAAPQPG